MAVGGVPVVVGDADGVAVAGGAVGLAVPDGLAPTVAVIVGDGVTVPVRVGDVVGVDVTDEVAVGVCVAGARVAVGVNVAHKPAPGVPAAMQTALNTGTQESPH